MPNVRTLTIGGVTYSLQDNVSGYITGITSSDVTTALGFIPYNATNPNGYTSNTGTITSVKTTAGTHTTINVSSGAANFNVPTKTSHLTNDSGFLTSYTETDPTVPSWAKASSKPSYNFSEIGNTPTTLSGYGITNAYTKTEVDGLVSGVLHYKGTKANYAALPSTGNTTGDVWHLTDTGAEWAWDGSAWQELGTAIDLSGYATIEQLATKANLIVVYVEPDIQDNSDVTLYKDIWCEESYTYYDIWYNSAVNEGDNNYRLMFVGFTDGDGDADYHLYLISLNYWDFTLNQLDGLSNFTKHMGGWNYTAVFTYHALGNTISYNDLSDKPTIPTVPTNVSAFTNDSGYLTSYTETDPTVPSWAKASSKPSYGLTEISGTDDLRAIEGLTGTSGLLKKTAANTWTLDTNTYLTSYTETDPTVPSWAKASTKPTYTAAEVGALPDSTVIPSKTSELTNDSGFITSYTDEKLKTTAAANNTTYYPIIGNMTSTAETKYYSNKFTYEETSTTSKLSLGSIGTEGVVILYSSNENAGNFIRLKPVNLTNSRTITLPDKAGTIALTDDIPTVPTKVSDLTNDSGFISSYTETDPVFTASAAAGITATDISNWNAKVSDDKTWNNKSLLMISSLEAAAIYVPQFTSTSATSANVTKATSTPEDYAIAKYSYGAYLKSTTPSANDNSTKVATTAYVDAAIPDTSGFSTTDEKLKITNALSGTKYYPIIATDSTTAATRQYDKNGFVYDVYRNASATGTGILTLGNDKASGTSNNVQGKLILFGSTAYSHTIEGVPTADRILTLPNNTGTIALTSDIPQVYSSTNTGGYLTMATLPIYDGTVV